METDLLSLFGLHVTWCAQLYSLDPPPPSPRIGTRIRGRYWSAKIDDISLYVTPCYNSDTTKKRWPSWVFFCLYLLWMRFSRMWMRSGRVVDEISRVWMRFSRLWMRPSRLWMRSTGVVRAPGCQCKSQQFCVRSQHPPTQRNLKGGGWSSVE